MARGGARNGAGRRKGTPNKATADVKETAAAGASLHRQPGHRDFCTPQNQRPGGLALRKCVADRCRRDGAPHFSPWGRGRASVGCSLLAFSQAIEPGARMRRREDVDAMPGEGGDEGLRSRIAAWPTVLNRVDRRYAYAALFGEVAHRPVEDRASRTHGFRC